MAGVAGMGSPKDIVAQKAPELDLEALYSETMIPAPEVQAAPSAQAGGGLDMEALYQESLNQVPLATDRETPGMFEQISEFPARLEASFAMTPKEQQFVLERRYGSDNVRKRGNDFQIKKGDKWRDFDSEGFEILNDLIGDGGRGIVEQGATELSTAGAATLTAPVSMTGAGLAVTIPAIASARAAGGAIGTAIADHIAESLYDIPRDPERSRTKELATSAVINATFGKVGDMIGSYFAKKGAEKATRLMGQKVDDVLKADIGALKEASDALEKAALLDPVQTAFGKTTYLPESAVMDGAPDITFRAKVYADNPEVIRVKGELGAGVQKVITQINDKIAAAPQTTGSKILSKVANIELEEGRVIGDFRKDFLEEGGNAWHGFYNTRDALKKVQDTLGYIPGSDEAPKDAASIMLQKRFEKFTDLATNGNNRVGAETLADAYDGLNEAIKNARLWDKPNRKIQEDALLDLWRGVRDDYSKAIGVTLGDKVVKGKTYSEHLKRFAEIKGATKDLKNLLIDPNTGKATITAESFAQNLFGNTKATAKDIQAAKTIFKDDPKVWDQIRRIRLDDLLKKSYDPVKESYNGVKFTNSILSMPNEVAEELAGGKEGLNLLKAAQVYSNRLQNYTVENLSDSKDAKDALSRALALTSNFVQAKGLAVWDLFSAAGKSRGVAKYLDGAGRDEMLKLAPVDARTNWSKAIDYIVDAARESDGRSAKAAKFILPREAQMKAREKANKKP